MITNLMSHLDMENVLSLNNLGSNHSTIDTICCSTSNLLQGWNERLNLISVFIDLNKAVDTMSHMIILNKAWSE